MGLLRRSERGQALVLVAFAMVSLLSFMGLGVDVGVLRYERRMLQTVADSAAIGGASELNYGDVTTGAQTAASKNGFTNGVNGATLTVNNPPLAGPHASDSNYVEAIAAQPQATYFAKIFGVSSVTISARAVAYLGAGPGCIYALNPSATNAILGNGPVNVQAGCGIVDDSNAGQALLSNGGANFTATSIGVAGNYLVNGGGTLSPTPRTGMVPQSDPLAYLPKPSVGSCGPANSTCTLNSTCIINGTGNFTLSPGVYCGGIIINGTPNVTFNSGIYILTGGIGLIMNGTVTGGGTGVMFYNASSGGITINGGNSFQLSAPTTGTYAGILVFQDPSNTMQGTINGVNSTALQGALYFPKAPVVVNGGNTAAAYSILVADTITFNGNDTFNDNYSSLPGGSPIKAAVLVE